MLLRFRLYLLVLSLFAVGVAMAQCPTNITLATQAGVNNFATNFPTCTAAENLTLSYTVTGVDPITSLSGLSQLTSIASFTVTRQRMLQDLSGLENVTEIDALGVSRNDILVDLDGLQNATIRDVFIAQNIALVNLNGLQGVTTPEWLRIELNSSLTSLDGLQNVTAIGYFREGRNPVLEDLSGLSNLTYVESLAPGITDLTNFQGLSSLTTIGRTLIYDNDYLTSLDGLESVTTIQGVASGEIARNSVLTNLDGLRNLTTFSGTFSWFVTQNPMLSSCANTGVCALIDNFPPIQNFRFTNNATGCSSATQVTDACALLPVTLTAFDGIAQQQGIQLQWTTAQESNNAGFSVERLTAQQKWEALDFVSGNGNSTNKQHYRYLDTQPAFGSNYYRLRQIDYDGSYHDSFILSVNWTAAATDLKISTYPNPAAAFFHLEFPEAGQLAIYSPTGEQLVQRATDGKSLMDCSAWPSGVYLVKWMGEGMELVERVIVK